MERVRRLAATTRYNLIPIVVFVSLSIFVLRGVLAQPGIVGFGWDWDVVPTSSQVYGKLYSHLFAWNPTGLGQPTFISTDMYYILVIYVISFLGGDAASKATLIGFQVLAGLTILHLCKSLKLDRLSGTLAGCFYMLSPFAYSRIVAGHLEYLLCYALLPLLFSSLMKSFSLKKLSIQRVAIIGVIFSLVSQVHVFLGLAVLAVLLVTVGALSIRLIGPKLAIGTLAGISLVFCSLNANWLLPYVANFGSITGTFLAGQPGTASARATSPYLIDTVRLLASSQDLGTETIYPVGGGMSVVWSVTSFLLPLTVMSAILTRPRDVRMAFFSLTAVVGTILVSAGKIGLYDIVLPVFSLTGPFFGAFENLNRFFPLVTLSYAVLFAYLTFYSRPSRIYRIIRNSIRRSFNHKPPALPLSFARFRLLALASLLTVLVIFPWPFYSNQLVNRPSFAFRDQPLEVLVIPPDNGYPTIYNFLKNQGQDFRLAYLPSPYAGYPTSYWLGNRTLFHGTTRYLPVPDLFTQGNDPFTRFLKLSLYKTPPVTQYLGSILGSASVRYLLYTDVKSESYIPGVDAGSLKQVLSSQVGLEEAFSTGQPKTTLYEIPSYAPIIRPLASIAVGGGDFSTLVPLASFPYFDFRSTGLLFPEQISPSDYQQLANSNETVALIHNNNILDLLEPLLRPYLLTPRTDLLGSSPYAGWTSLEPYWSSDWDYAARISPNEASFTRVASPLDFEFTTSQDGPFEIGVLAHVGLTGSKLDASVDEIPLGTIETRGQADLGFLWFSLGRVNLSTGPHLLQLKSGPGENAVAKVAVFPQGLVNETIQRLPFRNFLILTHTAIFGNGDVDLGANLGITTPLLSGPVVSEDFENFTQTSGLPNWQINDLSKVFDVAGPSGHAIGILPLNAMHRDLEFPATSTGLRLNFSISVPSLENPANPDDWAALILNFDDGSQMFYAAGGPVTQRSSPSLRVIMIANGTTQGYVHVTRDVQSDVEKEFGTIGKRIVRIYLATHTAEAYFDHLALTKVTPDTLLTTLSVPKTATYTLFVRSRLLSENTGGNISVTTNGYQLTTPVTSSSYQWYSVGAMNLPEGSVQLNVSSAGNSGLAIDTLALLNYDPMILPIQSKGQMASMTTNRESPSEFLASGDSSHPFYLAFTEAFDSRWDAIVNGVNLPKMELDGFGMVFHVTKAGPFNFRLIFRPQGLFDLGIVIGLTSSAFLFGVILGIPVLRFLRRKRSGRLVPQAVSSTMS
jgi:hypothetical protein